MYVSFNLAETPEAARLEEPTKGSREFIELYDYKGNKAYSNIGYRKYFDTKRGYYHKYNVVTITGKPEEFGPNTIQLLNRKTEALLKVFQSAGQNLQRIPAINPTLPSVAEGRETVIQESKDLQ